MLVNCGIYEKGQRIEAPDGLVGLGNVGQYGQGRFAWVALHEPSEAEMLETQKLCSLPDLAVEDALHGGQQPKIEEYGKKLFVSFRQFELGKNGELLEGEVGVFADGKSVVSVRHGNCSGFAAVRDRAASEQDLLAKGPAFVLYALLDVVVDRYFPVMVAFENKVEVLEERIFSKSEMDGAERKRIAYELYDLKRELGRFKHGVEPLLETTMKLFGGRVPSICEGLGEYFRDVHDHLSRILASAERLRDALASATQTNLALVTIDESVTTKKLAAWAAIFAASTLMAGVWGMNFKHMPELDWIYGYPLALGLMVGASVAMWVKFKKIGWL